MTDFKDLMRQAQEVRDRFQRLQEELGGRTVEGSAGGGMVVAVMNGRQELLSVRIEKEVVSPDDVGMLQDLVRAAVNDALVALPGACGRRDVEGHGRDAAAGDPVTAVYPKPLRRLVLLLSRLPGIGEKTATRLSMFLLKMPPEFVRELGAAIAGIPESVTKCSKCFNIADEDPCAFCADPARRDDLICVVEGPTDIVPIEKSGEFKGRYHVLGGAISPIDGVMPDDLRVRELLERTARGGVSEVILATNLTAEGESTASYLAEVLKARNIRVSRIAYGLPMGADLEYADEITVGRAMKGRREL